MVRVYGNAHGLGTLMPSEYITIDPDDERMIVHSSDGLHILSVRDFNMELQKRYLDIDNTNLDQKDLTFMTESGSIEVRVFLQNYSMRNPQYGATQKLEIDNYYTVSGYALVRERK